MVKLLRCAVWYQGVLRFIAARGTEKPPVTDWQLVAWAAVMALEPASLDFPTLGEKLAGNLLAFPVPGEVARERARPTAEACAYRSISGEHAAHAAQCQTHGPPGFHEAVNGLL